MLRLVVLASGRGSNFIRIAEACSTGEIDATVAALFTDKPSCGAVEAAERFQIPAIALNPNGFESRAEFDLAAAEAIEAYHPELLVFAGYMRLVDPVFISRFESRMINVHPSLLPSFAGADGVGDALEYGVKITGVTVHYVTEVVDSGPIILQQSVEILDGEEEGSLRDRIHQVEHQILPEAIRLIAAGKVSVSGRKTRIDL